MKYTFRSLFKIRAVYLIITIFLMVLSFFVYKQLEKLIKSSSEVNRSTEVALELQTLMGYIKDAEAGHRGYLLTHDSTFLESFYRGLREYPKHIKRARLLTAGNATQQKNLYEIKQIIEKRETHMRHLLEIDKTRRPSNYELRMGKWIMDSLREQVEKISAAEDKVLNQRTQFFRKQSIITPAFLLVISLGALGILFLSYNKINNELNRSKSLQRIQQLMVMDAPAFICMMRGPDHIYEMANEEFMKLVGGRSVLNKPIRMALPELAGQGFYELLDDVYKTGLSYTGKESLFRLNRMGSLQEAYINFVCRPSTDESGIIEGVLVYGSDVTDQVLSRKRIEENEEQLRIAVEGGELGMFDYYPETGKLIWSAKTKEMFGIKPDVEIDYNTFVMALHPEDKESSGVITNSNDHSKNGGFYDLEYRVIGISDQKLRWIRSKGKTTFANGKPVRFTGVTQDITHRKLAEEILKESEERFRTLVMSLPAAVYACDKNGYITFFNDVSVKLWGRAPKIGRDQWCGSDKIFLPNGAPIPLDSCPMAIALKEGKAIMGTEIIIERPDGSRATVLAHPQPQWGVSGEITGAINMLIDITPQVDALKMVKESEGRFRLLAETLPQLVWVSDERGVVEYSSHRWEEYSGIAPNKDREWKEIVHPDDYENINKAWIHSLATGNTYQFDVRLKNKLGEYRWHTSYGEPVLNSNHKIIKWVGAFTDIHSQREFSEQLENQVLERTHELALKNEELEKMNKELESFTYVSSHDLQEPLRKIQAFSSRILEKEGKALSEVGKDYFSRMQSAASRMQLLIEDLLAFSRASTGERNFEKVNLNTLVEEVKAELKDSINEKGATLDVAKLCEINVIPFQFRQLMNNLISNSLKFIQPDASPHIIIDSKSILLNEQETKSARVHNLSAALTNAGKRYCHIRVKDNGIGFEPRFSERIFEVFQRLHGKNEYVGTGIGLAIVKKIVDNHGGFITATGAVGKGATFDIYIPHRTT